MANFITSNIDEDIEPGLPSLEEADLPTRWILSRLNTLIENTDRMFDNHLYGEPGRQMYDFLWSEFADWYIEISKHALYGDNTAQKQQTLRTLTYVLETCLRLLHPYMPFVTEEIWQHLPHEGETIMLAQWPTTNSALHDPSAEAVMTTLMEMVRGIRNVRSEYNVDPGHRIKAIIAPGSYRDDLETYSYVFARLCNVEEIELLDSEANTPSDSASVIVNDAVVYLPLAGMVDIEAECGRLAKEQEKLQQQAERSQNMLNNENFVTRAKPEVVERERQNLSDLQASMAQIEERITSLCQ